MDTHDWSMTLPSNLTAVVLKVALSGCIRWAMPAFCLSDDCSVGLKAACVLVLKLAMRDVERGRFRAIDSHSMIEVLTGMR